MKPAPHEVLREARKLKDERFNSLQAKLAKRQKERFNETTVDVPDAYATTAHQHSSNIIDDEGRQIATLVYAIPTPHLTPPVPEDQPLTTKVEQFLTAMHQELEDKYGPVWWQCTMAQTHDNIGWIYFGKKKKPYAKSPKAAPDDADEETKYESGLKIERYKKDEGICGLFEYEFAVTGTVLHVGSVYDPNCLYVWKDVPRSQLKKTYGFTQPGYREGDSSSDPTITVVEYWDRDDCVIVAETGQDTYIDGESIKQGQVLDSYSHKTGRVPYFARPAFVTEQLDEDKKFAGPLDGIHNEMPSHKRLRTMMDSVAYQTAFSPMKITTKEQGEVIVDAEDKPLVYVKPVPGQAMQLRPGQDIGPIAQSPEVGILAQEVMASQQRIERYTLSPVAKGISPGADTANAALSNLHRFQLSTLDPMAKQTARQARAMYRYALECIRDGGETVYVLDPTTDSYLALGPEDIVSVNVQVKATPDQGQQQLLIEKHATELWVAGAITETEMHEMRGKENPEEYVLANAAERLRKQLEPVVMQQIIADLGMLDAVNAMIQANAEQGSARNAVPGLMGQVESMNQQQSGMGQGSPGQPRDNGVRMPVEAINTQRELSGGY